MRLKAAGLIVLTVFLVLILGFFWQIKETQRTSADLLQLGGEETVQPSFIETEAVIFSLTETPSGLTEVSPGQTINYTISCHAKRDLKKARIVGALGETKKKIYPVFSWDLGDLKKGTSASFTVPVTISAGETNLAVSRVTISEMEKSTWWGKEKRKTLATIDDINQIISQ
jgi:hypothetical protein